MKRRNENQRERCKTGINVLDKGLNGGIPQGATILIAGGAGVGKITLCMEFCANGINYGEKGVFFTATENVNKIKKYQGKYDFFDENLNKSGQLSIIDTWNIGDRLGLNNERYTFEEATILLEFIRDIFKRA